MSVRYLVENDAKRVAQINIEGWQTAYRGIFPDDFLDSLDVESITDRLKTTISEYPMVLFLKMRVSLFWDFVYLASFVG